MVIHQVKVPSITEDKAIGFLKCKQIQYHTVHANCNPTHFEALNNYHFEDILQWCNMNHHCRLFHFKASLINLLRFHMFCECIDGKAMSLFCLDCLLSFNILLTPMKIIGVLNYTALLMCMDMKKLFLLRQNHQFWSIHL